MEATSFRPLRPFGSPFALALLTLAALVPHHSFAQGSEPNLAQPTRDEPEAPTSLERVAYDHYWDLLGHWRGGRGTVEQENINRLNALSDIIYNEIDDNTRLRYLNRLGDVGYAAYARAARENRRGILRLRIVTDPSEALGGATARPETVKPSPSDSIENDSAGGWGDNPGDL